MHVFECGTLIETKVEKIKGYITAFTVRFGSVQYELSYFNNGEAKTCWLNECEFTTSKEKTLSIGFKPQNK